MAGTEQHAPAHRGEHGPLGGSAAGGHSWREPAASDGTAIAIAGSNPETWGWSGWLKDIMPHPACGLMVALVFRALRDR